MSYMLTEIREQPAWVERALGSEVGRISELAREIRQRQIRTVVVAARGTSDNAATYAKYLFEIVAGMPVALAAPSVATLYDARLHLSGTLVMGISQSGRGDDIVQVLSSARAAGALTACITNSPDAPLSQVSDHVLLCNAGDEKAVAATKTYTTSLAVVAQLVAEVADRRDLISELRGLPKLMAEAIGLEEQIAARTERYRYMHECAVLARGINQPTALEAALKLTETCYLVAKPYSGADFVHGPIAMVDSGFPVILFAPSGRAYPFMLELAVKLRGKQAEIIGISDQDDLLGVSTTGFRLPAKMHELLSPLVAILPAQLFACYLSHARGIDPDSPRGLQKVTTTT